MYGILFTYMSDTMELGIYVMVFHYVKVQGLVFKSSAYCAPVGNSVSAPPHICTAEHTSGRC